MKSEQELERQVASGDAAAKFELGVTFLTGPRAVTDGARGIALIEEAAAQGDADASERSALFEVMGIGRQPSWDRALDRLQRASELGSSKARAQLLLLCGRDPEVEGVGDGVSWAELRDTIQVDRLLEPGARRALAESPWIRTIEGLLRPAECRWLIANARENLEPATIFDKDTGMLRRDPVRNNSGNELQLIDMDLITELVRTRIARATKLPLPLFEPSQVLHYSVGEEFQPHYDFLDPSNPGYREQFARRGQRVATFLIYLNEEFEGGETDFPAAGMRLRGKTGDALFFANVGKSGRPDPLTLHAGLPPTKGEKWIFSQWIRDRPPAPAGQ